MTSIDNPRLSRIILAAALVAIVGLTVIVSGCGKTKEIIRYRDFPTPVSLETPPADTFITAGNPTFIWHSLDQTINYQLQVAKTSDFVSRTIDIQTTDTSHTAAAEIPNSTYFWRVRAQNQDALWGDWSDADIRTFIKSDYVNYFDLVAQINTYGVPQDAFLRNDTLYVADGQADLTLVDVSMPANPMLIRNIDSGDDDFAKGVFVPPTSFTADPYPFAYVADMDGRIQAMNVADSTFLSNQPFGTDQNIEDVTGVVRTFSPDSTAANLWIFAVSSGFNRRKISYYEIKYEPLPNPWGFFNTINLPADAMGLCLDEHYAYVACGSAGLAILDITDLGNVVTYPAYPLTFQGGVTGPALSIEVSGDYAYLAADRAGLFVVNIRDRRNPVTVAQINTSGRSKDVQITGNYAYLADADGGLKLIDISVPESAHFAAAYATPYAYGLLATPDHIYLCDRDFGLMVFENRIR